MDKFVVMEEEKQILGMFSTREAAEAARLEYCKITAKDNSLNFMQRMERTFVLLIGETGNPNE